MKLFGFEVTSFAKALVILATVFLVASGLCGLQWIFATNVQGTGAILIPLGFLELAAMAVSAVGIVVVLLLWIGSAVYRRIAHPGDDDPQSLFDSTDDSKHDGRK
jgi:hypothetical protein